MKGYAFGGFLEYNQKPTQSENLPTIPGKEYTNSIGMEFVSIPSGNFQMGCSNGDSDCDSDEKPQHKVTITKSFYLGKYEVTQGQ